MGIADIATLTGEIGGRDCKYGNSYCDWEVIT